MRLIMTKGLPGSGKSTWAKEQAGYKRINKDDLRSMLDHGKWSGKNEKFIIAARNALVETALAEGHNVIVDDTNLHPKHEEALKEIAAKYKAKFNVQDFTGVPIDTCIKQDLMRANSVGERVIRNQYKQFLAPKVVAPVYNSELDASIICDIDGTLALFGDASPYDRDYSLDTLNIPVAGILNMYAGITLIIVSGRKSSFREVTENWLKDNGVPYSYLYMRDAEDTRKDYIVKQEIYDAHIKDKYNVLFVLDDRNQVVELWRSLGLTCLQVADGDF